MTTILGIDPGSRKCGWAAVRVTADGLKATNYGTIKPPPAASIVLRLRYIYSSLAAVADENRPDSVAVETCFVRHPKTALVLGQARGVVLLAGMSWLPVTALAEYTPTEVKLAVAGRGGASKDEVKESVLRLIKGVDREGLGEDAADALAIAATCAIKKYGFQKGSE